MSSKPTIAVFGINGNIGGPVLDALTSPDFKDHYHQPVRALTRELPTENKKDSVEYYKTDLDDPETLDNALKGVTVLVNTASPAVSHKPLVDAAARQGVQVYFPSEFGLDYRAKDLYKNLSVHKREQTDYATSQIPKVVSIYCGLFIEWVVNIPQIVGIIPDKQLYVQNGDEDFLHGFVSVKDIAKSIAAVSLKPVDEIPERLRLQGDAIRASEIVGLYEKYHAVTLARHVEPTEVVLKKAAEADDRPFSERNMDDLTNLLQGVGANPEAEHVLEPNDSETVNPGQSLWKWAKVKSEVEAGWGKSKN